MNTKKIKKVFIAFIVVVASAIYLFQATGLKNDDQTLHTDTEAFRQISGISYTKHAKCRMECRSINEREIKEIIKKGILNQKKSGYDKKYNNRVYVIEGYSYERQHIRVVVTPEKERLLVITVIDLDRDWVCDCN